MSSSSSSSSSDHFQFPTFTQPLEPAASSKARVPTKDLSIQQLAQLKKTDAFAFYSIPAAKEAALRGASVDLRRLSAASSSTGASNTSSGANDGGSDGKGNDQTVERKKRISFEGYPDDMVINIEDLMLDWDESDDDEDGDDDEEDTSTDLQ
jgi:hypothetical protein